MNLNKSLLSFFILFFYFPYMAFALLSVGEQIPSFKAINQNGQSLSLNDYKGKFLLIYFYPKDGTPGCREEAQEFSRLHKEFQSLNTVILGVSSQDQESHKDFKSKESIPFDLITDEKGELAKLLGVGIYPLIGLAKRQSLLIDQKGKLIHFYEDVDPKTHAQEILRKIKELKN